MLDISPRLLEKVLYFASYIVTDPGLTPLDKKQLLTEKEYREMRDRYGDEFELPWAPSCPDPAEGDRSGSAER